MSYYLYRVQITSMPKGSTWEEELPDGETIGGIDYDWTPPGWEPNEDWAAQHGGNFFWPSTRREYKSRSAAKERARLIESFGATCIVQRSSPVEWPEDGAERITVPDDGFSFYAEPENVLPRQFGPAAAVVGLGELSDGDRVFLGCNDQRSRSDLLLTPADAIKLAASLIDNATASVTAIGGAA